MRRKKEIYYFVKKNECDFIIKDNLKISEAIQVTKEFSTSEQRNREIKGLISAMDEYNLSKGLIITEDVSEMIKEEGKEINVIPIIDWLLQSNDANYLS